MPDILEKLAESLEGEIDRIEQYRDDFDQGPLAWQWRDSSISSSASRETPFDRHEWWRSLGYVLWDDDRMLTWARRMGLRRMERIGFIVK